MKRNLKRLIALLLTVVMALGCFAGCGPTSQGGSTTPTGDVGAIQHPVTTDPITIEIMTWRHSTATNDADDIWFFKYLEYWLHEEYGYNVTIKVTQTNEPEQDISLALGTDTLPDLVWGINLEPTQAVYYGTGEKMILDWTPYINENAMPNLYTQLQKKENAWAASITPDGAMYSIPNLGTRKWNTASSSLGLSQDRMFIDTTWLAAVDLEMPTNWDEFVEMLRKFKNEIQLEDGQTVIPLAASEDKLEKALWTMMGYYGGELSKYGTEFAIKDGEVVLPVYTEDYALLMKCMNQLWTEGLLNEGHFNNDKTTIRGLTSSGVVGAASDSTMGSLKDWINWECMPWFSLNGSELHISTNAGYTVGTLWASSKTKYPEVLALIVDWLYTPEGATAYRYGPMQGQDPLNMVDGWYFDEFGTITTKLVADGTYGGFTSYCYQYIFSRDTIGMSSLATAYTRQLAGLETGGYEIHTITDSVTGGTFTAEESTIYDQSNAQGHWFLSNSAVSRPYITEVNLPPVYMSEDNALDATDLYTTLEYHIIAESAKFITGKRPLSEIEAFQNELKGMGIETYIAMYKEAYEPFMTAIFGE